VGEVADEHDKVRPGLLQSASGDWYFPGLLRPDELSEQIPRLSVPDEAAYETVGGYVMSKLGRIAVVGDTVPVGGGTLSVTRMDGRRIDRICFRPAADSDDNDRADSSQRDDHSRRDDKSTRNGRKQRDDRAER
jgi:CBS domain containing-hemolysin-like protein